MGLGVRGPAGAVVHGILPAVKGVTRQGGSALKPLRRPVVARESAGVGAQDGPEPPAAPPRARGPPAKAQVTPTSARWGATQATNASRAPLAPKRGEPQGPGEARPHDGDADHPQPSGTWPAGTEVLPSGRGAQVQTPQEQYVGGLRRPPLASRGGPRTTCPQAAQLAPWTEARTTLHIRQLPVGWTGQNLNDRILWSDEAMGVAEVASRGETHGYLTFQSHQQAVAGCATPGNGPPVTRAAASGSELCPLGGGPPGRGVRPRWCPAGGATETRGGSAPAPTTSKPSQWTRYAAL